MTTYLITYGTDPSDRFAARAYPTRSAAWTASLPTASITASSGLPRRSCSDTARIPSSGNP